jgi:Zn-dependent protease
MLQTLLQGEIFLFVAQLFILTIAFAYHEFAHAITADYLGDPTPRKHGRISLNPFVHLDLFGMIMLIVAGFGWAVTPVTPHYLRGNMRQSMALVAIAGPLANLLMAFLFAIPVRLIGWDIIPATLIPEQLFLFLVFGVYLNILLFCFNLLPIPPLDGFTILLGLLPTELAYQAEQLRPYGTLILLFLFLSPRILEFNLIFLVIGPVINFLMSMFVGFNLG